MSLAKTSALRIAPLLGLTFAVACGGEPAPAGKVSIAVAPLDLTGIDEAIYRITVKNAAAPPNNVVWQQDSLASTTFGDGHGSLTYVGTCDATSNPHVVELELLALYSGSLLSSPGDYANPAPAGSPIRLGGVMCVENADVLVRFDLTVMRNAEQGFFDIAVNFDDIFCSAKLDCREALLHDGDVRSATAVLAFACTAGAGDSTFMYLSDLTLTCVNPDGSSPVVTTLPIAGIEDGQQGAVGAHVFGWAQYSGREFVESEFEKCYWDFAVGIDTAALAGKRCTLAAMGTASDSQLAGLAIPGGGAYPVIHWQAEVLSPSGALCTNQALDGGGGVWSSYVTPETAPGSLMPLAAERRCGDAPAVACGSGTPIGDVAVRAIEGGMLIDVTAAGTTTTTSVALSDGWRVAAGCCEADCCASTGR